MKVFPLAAICSFGLMLVSCTPKKHQTLPDSDVSDRKPVNPSDPRGGNSGKPRQYPPIDLPKGSQEPSLLGNFRDSEVSKIASHIFGESKNLQFVYFEDEVTAELGLSHGSRKVTTHKDGFKTIEFDLMAKPFCEDFSLQDTRINTYFRGDKNVENRWTGANGKARLGEMQRMNKLFNSIRSSYQSAVASNDQAKIEFWKLEGDAYWSLFMACLAYGESGVFWNKKQTSQWRSKHNDVGIFQFNPDQVGGGNITACIESWNTRHPKDAIDSTRFRKELTYREQIVSSLDQRFNTFCGANKITQNLASQDIAGDACLNPYKKGYAHFGALMATSDHNFLRCSRRLLSGDSGDLQKTLSQLKQANPKTPATPSTH